MKKDRQPGQPGTYYRVLLDDRGADMNSAVRRPTGPLFHRLPEKKRLDHRGMASFLRRHPELWDKDHGRIKAALVDGEFCFPHTDIVDLDINWLVAKASGKLERWREHHH